MTEPDTADQGYLLELQMIGRSFGDGTVVHALRDVDLKLERGEWLAITGPSGAGKSTLLNVLGLLDQPTSGRYLFEGINTAEMSDAALTTLRSQRIGFIFQSYYLMPHRTVIENVMMGEIYRQRPRSGRYKRALAVIERVGLAHRAEFTADKLSGGEKQRVAIARALIGDPNLLLCDEPTGNLDSKSGRGILKLLESLNEDGLTLIVVTHDEHIASRANRRVNLLDGKLSRGEVNEGNRKIAAQNKAETRPVVSTFNTGIAPVDLLEEAVAGIFSRPGRMALTILGIIIGLTALVATLGLSRTASNRIISQFDELSATEITVTGKTTFVGAADLSAIPWDAESRLLRLNGVVAAGTLSEVDIGNSLLRTSPIQDPQNRSAYNLTVMAASNGLFKAVRADMQMGRILELGFSSRTDRVAVLGENAAKRLGITRLEWLPAVAIGDYTYLVIGILQDVARQPVLLNAVIIPVGTARQDFNLEGAGTVVIETQIGAAALISRQAILALRPDDPGVLAVEFAPEPRRVRDAVQGDLNTMVLILSGLSLIVGAIGIGNTTLVAVIERTGEIGLRRALGASRWHIAGQFLLESTALGFIGGVLGACGGTIIIVAVSAFQVWTPVMDPGTTFLSPFVGCLIGLVTGTYPAVRAAKLEPIEALR